MVCTTHRWRGVDSKFQFRAILGGLAYFRDPRSAQSAAFAPKSEFAMDLPLERTGFL